MMFSQFAPAWFFLGVFFLENGTTDAPTWPTMLNPVGNSSCSASGSMALIMSSDGHERFCSTRYSCLAHTYGSSSSRSLIRDHMVRG